MGLHTIPFTVYFFIHLTGLNTIALYCALSSLTDECKVDAAPFVGLPVVVSSSTPGCSDDLPIPMAFLSFCPSCWAFSLLLVRIRALHNRPFYTPSATFDCFIVIKANVFRVLKKGLITSVLGRGSSGEGEDGVIVRGHGGDISCQVLVEPDHV